MARGPAYPYVDLEKAVGLARKLYDYGKRSAVPMKAVVEDAWGLSTTSSSGIKTLAAVKYFGLIDETGSGAAKSLKISDRGYRIVVDDADSPERAKALKDAAVSPAQYEHCWKTWGAEMPASMRRTLIFERGFIESTVDGFLRDYKKSVAFAKLTKGDNGEAGRDNLNDVPPPPLLSVGDYVQWESSGVLQFRMPRKVTSVDLEAGFALVEGSNTGIPVAELTVVPKPESPATNGISGKPFGSLELGGIPKESGMRQEVFSMTEGSVTIQWPATMSSDSFEDFKDWLKILERKVKRSVTAGQQATNDDGKDSP